MKNRCEVKGCLYRAKYALFKTLPTGEKVWLHICDKCEREIGRENLMRAGILK